jgi:uncharacterized protein (TIGR00297 family)
MNEVTSATLAVVAATFVGLAAYKKRTLAPSGAVAAAVVGSLVVIGAGWWGGVVLVSFFVTSSALSLLRAMRQPERTLRQARGHRRDAVQVAANGGVATLCAVLFGLTSESPIFGAFAGALAAATSDTWATEIGGVFGREPRLILSGKRVEPGVSGGVTSAGLIASVAGALLIAMVSAVGVDSGIVDDAPGAGRLVIAVTVAGFVGSVVDSFIGASVQAVYLCPLCGLETENRVHQCGTEAKRLRGIGVINNDAVNVAATLAGAIVAAVLTL